MSWCDNLRIGDKVSYYINDNYNKTGEIKTFIVDTQELLDNIKQFESKENFHGMKILQSKL